MCIGVQSRDISITTKERPVVHPVEKYEAFYLKGTELIFPNIMYYIISARTRRKSESFHITRHLLLVHPSNI